MTETFEAYIAERGKQIEAWKKLRETKYSDKDIRVTINSGRQYSGSDYANETYAQSCAQLAQAMIAYNSMIDARIERAQKGWMK